MNIINAISNRRSVRRFLPDNIDKNIIEKIIEAGIMAPSAENKQPWKFIVITNGSKCEMIKTMKAGFENEESGDGLFKNKKNIMSKMENTIKTMEDAPVTIFVLNSENKLIFNQTAEEKLVEMANIQSIGASIENMMLAALEYGIGSLWICDIYFAYDELSKWLNTDQQIIAAISFGYPNEKPAARPRKEKNILIKWK